MFLATTTDIFPVFLTLCPSTLSLLCRRLPFSPLRQDFGKVRWVRCSKLPTAVLLLRDKQALFCFSSGEIEVHDYSTEPTVVVAVWRSVLWFGNCALCFPSGSVVMCGPFPTVKECPPLQGSHGFVVYGLKDGAVRQVEYFRTPLSHLAHVDSTLICAGFGEISTWTEGDNGMVRCAGPKLSNTTQRCSVNFASRPLRLARASSTPSVPLASLTFARLSDLCDPLVHLYAQLLAPTLSFAVSESSSRMFEASTSTAWLFSPRPRWQSVVGPAAAWPSGTCQQADVAGRWS